MNGTSNAYIELRNNRDGQPRAFIVGTRVRVQDIYIDSEVLGRSPEEIVASLPHLTLSQVHAALSYYFDHRQEILDEIRTDKEFVAAMKQRTGPGPLEIKLRDAGVGDAISSG
jgi:uncharacterized protein (DUF433 family)